MSVEPAESGGRFALFVEESDDVGAGVAVFKPEAAALVSEPGLEVLTSRGIPEAADWRR